MSEPIVVGVVTYNNLPMIKKCFDSWRSVPNSKLAIWDNNSEPDVVDWLKQQHVDKLFLNPTNAGLCVGRNRIIEYNREEVRNPHILLLDSDVLLHEGSVAKMIEAMDADTSIGMVGFQQANQGFPMTEEGYVEEASNECILSRMLMWQQIGMFPETLIYYSSDSWKSTMANMHGWKTKLVRGNGYDHFAHGSHVNKPVSAIMRRDQEHWLYVEAQFVKYWHKRLVFGKGHLYKGDIAEENGVDWKVPDEIFEPDDAKQTIVKPTNQRQFTNWIDCQALINLMGHVQGNYLEIGCHQGLTLMQLAFNFPNATCYGIDSSGDDYVLPERQKDERPTMQEIGWQVRSFRNAKIFDMPFHKLGMDRLENAALVFIDADLTYDGVKAITERVLQYFYAEPKRRRIIAWHDYTPQRLKNEDNWIGVGDYVRKEMADRFVCRFIRGTNIAYMSYNDR